eukprot:717484-Amphidinium_carterae.2
MWARPPKTRHLTRRSFDAVFHLLPYLSYVVPVQFPARSNLVCLEATGNTTTLVVARATGNPPGNQNLLCIDESFDNAVNKTDCNFLSRLTAIDLKISLVISSCKTCLLCWGHPMSWLHVLITAISDNESQLLGNDHGPPI